MIWDCFFCIIVWFSSQKCQSFVCINREYFRLSVGLAMQDMSSCHSKTKRCVSISLHRSAAYLHHSHNSALHPRHHERPVPFQLRWVPRLNPVMFTPWQILALDFLPMCHLAFLVLVLLHPGPPDSAALLKTTEQLGESPRAGAADLQGSAWVCWFAAGRGVLSTLVHLFMRQQGRCLLSTSKNLVKL